jgi:hypothetical protein
MHCGPDHRAQETTVSSATCASLLDAVMVFFMSDRAAKEPLNQDTAHFYQLDICEAGMATRRKHSQSSNV